MTTLPLRFGLQFPRFSFPGVDDAQIFERVSASAVAAEENGFDTLFVMDHFWQLPMIGPPELPMLEGYSLLAALAARTRRARLGTLVTGVTYRNPALLAKTVTTLDVISGGRAVLGIGAAWYEEEHRGLGFEFPSVRERFERLEEALIICKAMFTEERPSFTGRHYRIEGALNVPRPITPGGPPILVGGSGEKRTLRLVAEHADASNLVAAIDEIPRKLDVLARHCADVGRDPATVNKSWLGSLILAPTHDGAIEKLNTLLAPRGLDASALDDPGIRAMVASRMVWGDPDEVGAQIKEQLFGVGLDGVVFNMPADGFDAEAVELAGKVLSTL